MKEGIFGGNKEKGLVSFQKRPDGYLLIGGVVIALLLVGGLAYFF
jgi:hypothetical protein